MVTISNNFINSQALTIKPSTPITTLLKVGQILSANVQPISNNQAQITIGNQTLLATTKTPIQESGTIQVRVNQLKPDIQLSIITSQAKPTNNASSQQAIQTAYRQFIPNQTPLSQVFQQINLLQSLPPSIQAPLQQLLDQVSKNNQGINGQSIKQKLNESGLFLESKLGSTGKNEAATTIKNDVKAQILQLQQQVSTLQQQSTSSSLNKLSTLLNQALSRLTVQQVQLFENSNITPLEVPFERNKGDNKDYIELRKNEQNEQTQWEAYVDLTLPTGLLSAKLKLSEQGHLDCYLWCETEELETNIANQIESLKQLLNSNDLQLNSIQITPKKPVKTDNTTKMALIDIKI
ncbi:MAG: hypothetical protein U9N57_12995 [Pseudomonadota bacterium]|nr:hypothetical protein [Pseudomonadota bacterium]